MMEYSLRWIPAILNSIIEVAIKNKVFWNNYEIWEFSVDKKLVKSIKSVYGRKQPIFSDTTRPTFCC